MFESKRAILRDQTFLLGYVSSGSRFVEIDGSSFELTSFQGEHKEEYLMKEVKGEGEPVQVQLFDRGLLKLSWTLVDGVRSGPFTLYENGVVKCRMDWKEMEKKDYVCSFENRKCGVQMVLTDVLTGHVVYRGQFDEDMGRSGYGYEYDEDTGRVLLYGVFKKNALVHLLKQFEEERMIEYAEDDSENVFCVFNRRPIYVGGYRYDEASEQYLRDGLGYEIDVDSGIASQESMWSNGERLDASSCRLNGGWYEQSPWTDVSFRCGAHKGAITLPQVKKKGDIICNDALVIRRNSQLGELSGLPPSVTEIFIPDNCYNEKTFTSLSLRSFASLRIFVVGRTSFQWVKTLDFGEREIDHIQIGIGSFSSVLEWVRCGGMRIRVQGNVVIGQTVTSAEDLPLVSHAVTDLTIESKCCDEVEMETWDLTPYWLLKNVLVESGNLNRVKVIDMTGLMRLQSLSIQSACFEAIENVLPPLITCDYAIRSIRDYEAIPTHVTTLRVCSGTCNEEEFKVLDLRRFGLIRYVAFGDHCLKYVKSFLESPLLRVASVSGETMQVPHDAEMNVEDVSPFVFGLKIGNHVRLVGDGRELCLSGLFCLKSMVVGIESLYNVEWIIRDMPRLESLRFSGASSISSYTKSGLQIRNCSALKTLWIGDYLFYYSDHFDLHYLPHLETVTIGNHVGFSETDTISFSRTIWQLNNQQNFHH